jgi:hypothetical protein
MMAVLLRSPPAPESAHHLADGLVNEVERVGQDRPGSSTIGKITARCASRRLPFVLEVGSFVDTLGDQGDEVKYVVKEDLKSELHPILEEKVTVWG